MKLPRHTVSDHAVLRYLERVRGLDVETVRRDIGRRVDTATEGHEGMCSVNIEGFRYILSASGVVVTVMPQHLPKQGQGGRKRRQRE
ncbi:hypothetical protein [uncultured Tateyamaria sp.]|uniref:hypothetical protein n=1 Tax=uncultured Tateyamaria sp. TaxID=455651 RepID=UPI00260FCD08|nr:hypothetical protein [uncultured Tateyamaria sp.]